MNPKVDQAGCFTLPKNGPAEWMGYSMKQRPAQLGGDSDDGERHGRGKKRGRETIDLQLDI